MDIILLEDEEVLRSEVGDFLCELGYRVDLATTCAEFEKRFDRFRHKVAILDLVLTDGSGLDLIKSIRNEGLLTGIVVVTARAGVRHRIDGLGVGADHYLCKPFELSELAATVSALSRRLETVDAPAEWVLDTLRCQLIPPGKPAIALSGASYIVLRTVVAGAGERVSRRVIVEALGEDYIQYDLRRLDSQIHYLRKLVLTACGLELPLRASRGQGYQTTETVRLKS